MKGHWFVLWLVAIFLIVMGAVFWYFREWVLVGFAGKTLWDFLELLIIPVALGAGAYLFNRSERTSDRDIAAGRNQEEMLSIYLDRMSELLTRGQLRDDILGAESRHIARARTLTVVRSLDGIRKGLVLRFLHDAELLEMPPREEWWDRKSIVDLRFADLSYAILHQANLSESNLSESNLSYASLHRAELGGDYLHKSNLHRADLTEANLHKADLSESNLSYANLSYANLFSADLTEADLSGAILRYANLAYANLCSADLTEANLSGANLSEANLSGANLSGANLDGASNVTNQQLAQAASMLGTTLPDGTKIDTKEQEAESAQQYGEGS